MFNFADDADDFGQLPWIGFAHDGYGHVCPKCGGYANASSKPPKVCRECKFSPTDNDADDMEIVEELGL